MVTALSARERRLIGELRRRFRRWAPSDERRPPALAGVLSRGFSNRCVLLQGDRGRYALRIASGPPRPGIDRQREARLLRLAAAAGIAPQPLFCDPRRGLLITAFLPCAEPPDTEIAALARLLRRIHRLPVRGTPMDSATALHAYMDSLDDASQCARLLRQHAELLARAREICRGRRGPVVTCHNDLLRANRCWDGGGLVALDWEYAAAGDPFFDIAVCASELDAPDVPALLALYLQRSADSAEMRHLDAQRLLYAALEACWWQRYGADHGLRRAALDRLSLRLEEGLRH